MKDGEITAEEKKKFKLKRQIVYTLNQDDSSYQNEDQRASGSPRANVSKSSSNLQQVERSHSYMYKREESVEMPTLFSRRLEDREHDEPRIASESRVLKSRFRIDNPMMAGGRNIVFKPILPPVILPSETKQQDN